MSEIQERPAESAALVGAAALEDDELDSWLRTERAAPTSAVQHQEPQTFKRGTITYYPDLIQGSDEWMGARCGLLTASEMKLIITPTLKVANNDKERAHLYELLAQRVTRYVEPSYISDDMLRGKEDEIYARMLYAEHYGEVTEMGFITNNRWGFTLGCSPDGLVGDDGVLECKSRRQKYQMQTIVERVQEDAIDPDYLLQAQTLTLVSERQWADHCSYSNGMHMVTVRVWPDDKVQEAIINAAGDFERRLSIKMAQYDAALKKTDARLIATERRLIQEMHL